jgi:hypothetical protein
MNKTFTQSNIHTQQKHGIIVCLPKYNGAQKPEIYQPFTLLNTDYKILARILAHRLPSVLGEHLRTSQFCSVPRNSIIEAVSTVREAIAQVEITDKLLFVLTLDIQEEFVIVSHQHVFKILRRYDLNTGFIDSIKDLYDNATASVQINGHLPGSIPIRCAVRQGCLLSMLLYAFCLQPLLRMLENNLLGIQIRHRARCTGGGGARR